jgi:hypothetical protein
MFRKGIIWQHCQKQQCCFCILSDVKRSKSIK